MDLLAVLCVLLPPCELVPRKNITLCPLPRFPGRKGKGKLESWESGGSADTCARMLPPTHPERAFPLAWVLTTAPASGEVQWCS